MNQQNLWLDLGQHWKWIALRGVAAVLFGILALIWPGIAITALVIIWGVYVLLDGILACIAALRIREQGKPIWSWLAIGMLGIICGLIALIWPGLTAVTLLLLIAVWAVVVGVLQIVAAIRWRRRLTNEWWLILSGVLSVVFGVLIALSPSSGAVALVWLIALYAIIFGVALILFALRLRKTV